MQALRDKEQTIAAPNLSSDRFNLKFSLTALNRIEQTLPFSSLISWLGWVRCDGEDLEYITSSYPRRMSWADAQEECRKFGRGASLATPRNKQQSECVHRQHSAISETVWLGMYSLEVDPPQFIYVDTNEMLNASSDYQNWTKGEPNRPDQRCVTIWTQRGETGWDNDWCSETHFVICQAIDWSTTIRYVMPGAIF